MDRPTPPPLPPPDPLSHHLRMLLVLGLPLIGSNVAQFGLHVTDTIMLGWYGVPELASVVLGASYFFLFFMLGSGFALAVMGRVSASLGSGDEVQARRDTRMGLWLSVLFGIATFPLMWFSGAILRLLGQDAGLAAMAQDYLRIEAFGMVPALIVALLRGYLSARERTQVVLWVTVLSVGLNAALNWVLIFGHLGAPEMGVRGAAIASLVVQVFSALALGLYAARARGLRETALFARVWRADWPAFMAVARMGVPIGLTSVAEGSLFQASALMMGWIGTDQLAAHGIALELASLSFMVHMGLSNAATVRAGRAHGVRDPGRLARGAGVAVALSMAFGLLTVAVFLAVPRPLVSLFLDTSDPRAGAILDLGVRLLAVAALFQLFDSLQVMALGLLRGVLDTRVPMWMAAASYWLVGIPASYLLAFPAGLGAIGLWLGLVVGLAAAGGALMWRFWHGPWLRVL